MKGGRTVSSVGAVFLPGGKSAASSSLRFTKGFRIVPVVVSDTSRSNQQLQLALLSFNEANHKKGQGK
jgi:hypothetical protein